MWLFKRKGASGFSYSNTAEEVTNGIDGSGLTAIVTGASSGIGSETARVLALRGVHVVMGVRNMDAGRKVKDEIIKEIPNAKVDAMELDLSSLESVKKFASDYTSSGRPLNLLMPFSFSTSVIRHHEEYISPGKERGKDSKCFIRGSPAKSAMSKEISNTWNMNKGKVLGGKAFNESTIPQFYCLYQKAFFITDAFQFANISRYSSFGAYGQSKLANILHANELARSLKEGGENITANSLHPGSITTNLFRHMGIFDGVISSVGKLVLKSVPQGASTTCYVALHPQVAGVSGKYFMDNNVATPTAQGSDPDLGKRLWDFSMNLVK
ncbi:hypothetical protein Leryth_026837 [Lithospermum erythrorhizon]|nr:hypothetical protein Leryth_026837 [Lithospermum erythrorhizon]